MEFNSYRVMYHPHSFHCVNLLPPPMPPTPSPLNPCAPPFLPSPPPPMSAFLPPSGFQLRHGVRCYRRFGAGKKTAVAACGGGRRIRAFVPPRLMPSKPKEEEPRPHRLPESKLAWIPKDFKPRPDTKTAGVGGDTAAAPGDRDGGEASGLNGRTTVMMRNIPNLFKRQDLIGILDEHCRKVNATRSGPRSEYDFVYLPIDYTRKMNKGYAFVNFTSAEAAVRMRRAFDGLKWEGFQWGNLRSLSKKVCHICAATTQGKAKLENSFRRRYFPSEEYQPVVAADAPRDGVNGAPLILVGNRTSP